MSAPSVREAEHDLGPLEAISDAVESGLGLPEVVRAAARALDSSLVLMDASSAVLAVAVQSTADERSLMSAAPGVRQLELRVGDSTVGRLLLRPRGAGEPQPGYLKLAQTLIASEVERIRAPARASAEAQEAFVAALLSRELEDEQELVARAAELGLDLTAGACAVVVRASRFAGAEDDWRGRLLSVAERAAHVIAPGSLAGAVRSRGAEASGQAQVAVLVGDEDAGLSRRVAEVVARELESALPGHSFTLGHSRFAGAPGELYRAANEALLAANVAAARPSDEPTRILSFEDTGAYRILLPAMSEDPSELERFYAETVEPLVAYDEQYETTLVMTLETFLDADGNVAGTAQRLFTHRHTIRYRLERVRELTGLDVSSTDGRENLGLGLKAMRVLGIADPSGPAHEAGTQGGRVRGRNR